MGNTLKTPVFSINGASDTLDRDRRSLRKALRDAEPDTFVHGRPRWLMQTIVDALAEYDRLAGRTRENGSFSGGHSRASDEIESISRELDAGLARLRAEPDLARRRALGEVVGPAIGRLDRALVASVPGGAQPILQPGVDNIVRGYMSEFLSLCDLRIDDAATG
jgi:hypothetical protein